MKRPAVFLDRDGTVIEHVHHLKEPADVRLIAGAAESVATLQTAGFVCVLVTNQSVVGRGQLSLDGLDRVHETMNAQLADEGVTLDGLYFCPEAPVSGDPTVIEFHDRKPGPGMLERAARDLDLDLPASWMIGDSISDMLAGVNAGCAGSVLVRTGLGHRVDASDPSVSADTSDIVEATRFILEAVNRTPQSTGI